MKKLYYFQGPWCPNCEIVSPAIQQAITRGIPVEIINIDYELDRAKRANVSSIPTVIMADGDQEIKRFTGPRTLEQIIQFYNS
jgi:thioredoxin-like negative regulator of GroEL